MQNYDLSNIDFTYQNIEAVFDNCSHLEKFTTKGEVVIDGKKYETQAYADLDRIIVYRLVKDINKLQLHHGNELVVIGNFSETEYILKVLRAVMQHSIAYEAKTKETDNRIFSVINQKPAVKYAC